MNPSNSNEAARVLRDGEMENLIWPVAGGRIVRVASIMLGRISLFLERIQTCKATCSHLVLMSPPRR